MLVAVRLMVEVLWLLWLQRRVLRVLQRLRVLPSMVGGGYGGGGHGSARGG